MVRGNGRKKKAKVKKEPALKFATIGVRFLSGVDVAKIYTYKVSKAAKVLLGQELVADTPRGPGVCAVVRIDSKPSAPKAYVDQYGPEEAIENLKWIERKVVPL